MLAEGTAENGREEAEGKGNKGRGREDIQASRGESARGGSEQREMEVMGEGMCWRPAKGKAD